MKSILKIILLSFVILFTKNHLIAQTHWTKDTLNNPVLDKGLPGSVDSEFVTMPSVLFVDSVYHMWYCYGNTQNFNYIGHAFSYDEINWIKDSLNNPVLEGGLPGSWDAYGISVPQVLFIDSLYHMWYKGYSTSSYAGHGAIGHAVSNDGIIWTKDTLNNPVLDVGATGEWDDVWIASGSVIFDGNIYHMWYHGWNGIDEQKRIGHAISQHPDSIWTKDSNNPVLSYETGKWDYPRVDAPRVVFVDTIFHMWYLGGNFFTWRIGHATSSDGSAWIKDDQNNPVLNWGVPNSWDDYGLGFCSVLFDSVEEEFKMWYSGYDNPLSGRIGYASSCIDTTPTGTVTDIDGNVYKTVKIGAQWWMAENLKVTHYQNGDSIPNVTDNTQWTNLTTGAYCNFDNDTTNVSIYGRLYNWYAVADSRNIAPEGWHVPSEAEWHILVDYLGGDAVAGGKLKATGTIEGGDGLWHEPNVGATNESGFTGLPGGYREPSGTFYAIGYGAYFWSSTVSDSDRAWSRFLRYNGSDAYRFDDKYYGYSVRLVRDSAATMIKSSKVQTINSPRLAQNYPNPFNPSTTIEFTLPKSEFVELKIYNILGKEISTIVSKKLNPGKHTYTFSGRDLASGVYYYRLEAGNFVETRKMIYLK